MVDLQIQAELIPPEPGTHSAPGKRWLASVQDLALLFDRKPVTINLWVKQGMPKFSHGRYDVAACVQWRLQQEEARAERGGDTATNERKRYDAARASAAELELDARRGEFVALETVRALLAGVAQVVSDRLEALPPRAAPVCQEIVGDTVELSGGQLAALIDLLGKECDGIRDGISTDLRDFVATPRAGRSDRTAAAANGGPVGGRETDPA